ncbi:hypothetical protein, partial [Stenotrophomonas maltophilia]|uniref:hypothetical protein n=1 Tax=Stenotrophomonas maltophilia TaxID=40324 RepID=UPI0019543F72
MQRDDAAGHEGMNLLERHGDPSWRPARSGRCGETAMTRISKTRISKTRISKTLVLGACAAIAIA